MLGALRLTSLQSTSTSVLSGCCRHVGVAAKKDEKPYAVLEDGFRPLASYRPGSVDLDDEKDENSPNRPWVNRVMVDPVENQKLQHRWQRMSPNQDWPNAWPTARSFDHSSVPLPLRMGFQKKPIANPPPDKYNNLELMKIPNFLHLTPDAIERQCKAIKKFCTPWPSGLKTEEDCLKHYPLRSDVTNWSHTGTSIRDHRSRFASLWIKLSELKMSPRARDKMLRLVGDRYNNDTDILTITTDRCPTRKQNYDYAMYLITALYHEAMKVETWESEHRSANDAEVYKLEENKQVSDKVKKIAVAAHGEEKSAEVLESYKTAYETLRNSPISTVESLKNYETSAVKLMGLTPYDDRK